MIEDLEAEAVAKLAAVERGGACEKATLVHGGAVIEVRARRNRGGAAVLGYSYDGVRLEREVLLKLICPENACERGQAVKQQWQRMRPATVLLQRRRRTPMKGAEEIAKARLFEDVALECATGSYVARPAHLNCFVACPVHAHEPMMIRKDGWDVFRDGKYVAGGLLRNSETGESTPQFPSVQAATRWLSNITRPTSRSLEGCAHE